MPAATKDRSAHDRSTVSEIFSVQHNCSSARNKLTDSTASPQTRLPRQASCMRAVLGIEPRTSRTLSENHTTRPNSRCSAPDVNTKALSEVVIQATHRHIQQRWQTGAWRAVRTSADVAPTHGGKLAVCQTPTLQLRSSRAHRFSNGGWNGTIRSYVRRMLLPVGFDPTTAGSQYQRSNQ